MGGANTLSALVAAALLAAAGFAPGAAIAGEVETNARRCADDAVDPDVSISACGWLLQSGRLAAAKVPTALSRRGIAWQRKGEHDRAIEDYTAALRLKPDDRKTLYGRGIAWSAKGEADRAIDDFTAALRIKSDDHKALYNRGNAWYRKSEYDRAIADYTAALGIEPDDYQALYNRGRSWFDQGEHERAIADYAAAVRVKPDLHQALNGLAWFLATTPEARLRDGRRAVKLAEQAVSLRDYSYNRGTLAAAYAEAGRFGDAVSAQERSLAKARAEGWSAEDITDAEGRLRLYRQGRPYRATP